MLALTACNDTDTAETLSLEVTPTQLSFAAEGAAPQEITVRASGVAWEYVLPNDASEWITIDDVSENRLTVSVGDNPGGASRTAALTFKTDHPKVKSRMVSIVQQGAENPETYALSIDPAALTFGAEGSAPQEVSVTAEGTGLTWSTEVAEAGRSWLTVAEDEGKFTVSVADNPEPLQRTADITVIPGDDSVPAKVVRVTQQAKVLPPSLTVTLSNGAAPDEGFSFDYIGQGGYRIDVDAVNCEWYMKTEYDTEANGWITASENEGLNSINVSVAKNENAEARKGRIVLSTDTEGVGPVTIPVVQEGKPDYISTLTEPVDFGTLTQSYVLLRPNNDFRDQSYTDWELRLWSEGITFDGLAYAGSGDRLNILLITEPIEANDDNEYYLPEGTYTVTVNLNDHPDRTASGRHQRRSIRLLRTPHLPQRHVVRPHGGERIYRRGMHPNGYHDGNEKRRNVRPPVRIYQRCRICRHRFVRRDSGTVRTGVAVRGTEYPARKPGQGEHPCPGFVSACLAATPCCSSAKHGAANALRTKPSGIRISGQRCPALRTVPPRIPPQAARCRPEASRTAFLTAKWPFRFWF